MKKLKDIFYDLNDIMVALIIVAIAAFLIATNIDSILHYPESIASEIEVPEEDVPTVYAENPPIDGQATGGAITGQGTTDTEDGGNNTTGGGVSGNSDSGSGEVADYSVYINYGQTGDEIADVLIGVGLFKDRQEFYNAVTAAGAESKLQAGNFIIPSDSTPAEVISIITN